MSSIGDIFKSLSPTRTNRFRVILLCAAAATTFWFLNAMNKQHTATLNYPIQFVYDDETYMEVDPLPSEVIINVNGMGWNLLRNNLGIKTSPLLIPLDNPSETKALSAISIPSLISDQISEFQLNYVLTDTLYINLDERSQKKFKLQVDSASLPLASGFRITSAIRITPDSVLLKGPAKQLESMGDSIIIVPQVEMINENFDQNISVPEMGDISSSDPPYAAVSFSVEQYVNETVQVPLKLVTADQSDSLTLDRTVQVSFSIAKNRVDAIGPENFIMVADIRNMTVDSAVTPTLVSYPLGLINLRIDSAAVSLKENE